VGLLVFIGFSVISLIFIFMDNNPQHSKAGLIKNLYLYLVSFVALMMIVFSSADIINIALRTYVLTGADEPMYYGAPCPVKPVATSTDESVPPCPDQHAQLLQDIKNRDAQRQRDLVRDISMIVVGIPLFAYHWRLARKKD
jgi:hypothetical protein